MSGLDRTAHLLAVLPPNARRLVQVRPASDALALSYKGRYPASCYQYVGDAAQPAAAADHLHVQDLDSVDDGFFARFDMADCWIFDGALETLRAPQQVLAGIARHLPLDACVVLCVANPACWSGAGQGLAAPALLAMLQAAGLRVASGVALHGAAPDAAQQEALRQRAAAAGADAEQALRDALPSHFLIKACPV